MKTEISVSYADQEFSFTIVGTIDVLVEYILDSINFHIGFNDVSLKINGKENENFLWQEAAKQMLVGEELISVQSVSKIEAVITEPKEKGVLLFKKIVQGV